MKQTSAGQRLLEQLLRRQKMAPEPAFVPPSGPSPFLVEFFMVRGIGFQCMAYRGSDGRWFSAFNGQELPGTIRVLEIK